MKKFLIFNLIFIILALVITEAVSYWKYLNKLKDGGIQISYLKYYPPRAFDPNSYPYNAEHIIRTFKQDSGKGAICFVGCSYTQGMGLKDEETFGYQISEKTKRTVYLRGILGTGLSYVYYQVLHKLIPQDSEYVVYTFINDHFYRNLYYQLYFWSTELNLRYILKDGKLKEAKMPFKIINSLYFTKLLQEKIVSERVDEEMKDYKLFKAIMADMIVQFRKNYPNSKFVFLFYHEGPVPECDFPEGLREYVESLGYIYLDANELSGKQLGSDEWKQENDKMHPSKEAWEQVAPEFIRQLNL